MDERKCRKCGCTVDNPCFGGCYWVAQDLCSSCATDGQRQVVAGYAQAQEEANEHLRLCPYPDHICPISGATGEWPCAWSIGSEQRECVVVALANSLSAILSAIATKNRI